MIGACHAMKCLVDVTVDLGFDSRVQARAHRQPGALRRLLPPRPPRCRRGPSCGCPGRVDRLPDLKADVGLPKRECGAANVGTILANFLMRFRRLRHSPVSCYPVRTVRTRPTLPCLVTTLTSKPDADWCLQSDVTPGSRVFIRWTTGSSMWRGMPDLFPIFLWGVLGVGDIDRGGGHSHRSLSSVHVHFP